MSDEVSKARKKYDCIPLEKDDMSAILDMTVKVMKQRGGRPCAYPNDERGLEMFRDNTVSFMDYVQEVNSNPDLDHKLIPDIEAWATYIGVTRKTIFEYEHRGGEWTTTIQAFKNAIASIKKQLLFTYKIPPMVGVFDLTNNHGYVNSNEFKLTAAVEPETSKNDLEAEVDRLGLVWDSELKDFVPREGV